MSGLVGKSRGHVLTCRGSTIVGKYLPQSEMITAEICELNAISV